MQCLGDQDREPFQGFLELFAHMSLLGRIDQVDDTTRISYPHCSQYKYDRGLVNFQRYLMPAGPLIMLGRTD